MPLKPGVVDDPATNEPTGMTKAVYEAMVQVLRPGMVEDGVDEETIQESQEAWKRLSHAIAIGVVTYLLRDPVTEAEYAEVYSSQTEDSAYWSWLGAFVEKLKKWAELENGEVLALQSELKSFFEKNAMPKELKGVIR